MGSSLGGHLFNKLLCTVELGATNINKRKFIQKIYFQKNHALKNECLRSILLTLMKKGREALLITDD